MAPKFDVYAHVTDTIIAEIEAGTPPWRKPWTGSASGIALPRGNAAVTRDRIRARVIGGKGELWRSKACKHCQKVSR